MCDVLVSRFEDLPIEMLIEIFQYLSVHEMYFSFSSLNTRLNSILKSLPNLILITSSHWDPALCFFPSFGTVQIHFNYPTSSSLSEYNFSYFMGIRSFIISSIDTSAFSYSTPFEQIDTFISPDLCPQLRSLRIPYYSQTLVDWIFTGAFPHLEICHHYNKIYTQITLPRMTTHKLQNLRQLTIRRDEAFEFEQILLLCPNLTFFDFSCNTSLSPFVQLNSLYLSLKRLRLSQLSDFLFHNGQFDSLLSFFPNLRAFYLIVDHDDGDDEIIDFSKIAHCLQERLFHLTALELRITMTSHNSSALVSRTFAKIAQMHPLFKFFGSILELLHIASFDITSMYQSHHYYIRKIFTKHENSRYNKI